MWNIISNHHFKHPLIASETDFDPDVKTQLRLHLCYHFAQIRPRQIWCNVIYEVLENEAYWGWGVRYSQWDSGSPGPPSSPAQRAARCGRISTGEEAQKLNKYTIQWLNPPQRLHADTEVDDKVVSIDKEVIKIHVLSSFTQSLNKCFINKVPACEASLSLQITVTVTDSALSDTIFSHGIVNWPAWTTGDQIRTKSALFCSADIHLLHILTVIDNIKGRVGILVKCSDKKRRKKTVSVAVAGL